MNVRKEGLVARLWDTLVAIDLRGYTGTVQYYTDDSGTKMGMVVGADIRRGTLRIKADGSDEVINIQAHRVADLDTPLVARKD